MSEKEQKINPLLSRINIPGETFRLPSQGVFYEKGELDSDVVNGEVEVYPLTAIDEIVMSSPDKLLSGKAIIEVFSRCVPQVKDVLALAGKDVDFLMVCLRYVSFGQFMEVKYKHFCENAKEHTYNIDLLKSIREAKNVDPTTVASEFSVVLPNGQHVVLKPLSFGDVLRLFEVTTMAKKEEDMSEDDATKLILSTLTSLVSQVDEVSDREFIQEWARKLPLGWKQQIQIAAEKNTEWGTNTAHKIKCKDCGEEVEINISINPVNFFS